MRSSVSRRGAAGATFDHVAAEAGVSRGLLHYYFGSKERLLVEVVRHDADLRVERFTEALQSADSTDAVIEVLVRQVREFVAEDPGAQALLYEMFSASRSQRRDPRRAGRAVAPPAGTGRRRPARQGARGRHLAARRRRGGRLRAVRARRRLRAAAAGRSRVGQRSGVRDGHRDCPLPARRFSLAVRDPCHTARPRLPGTVWPAGQFSWMQRASWIDSRRSSAATASSCSSGGSSCCSRRCRSRCKQTENLTSGGFTVPGSQSEAVDEAIADFEDAERESLAVVLAMREGADDEAVRRSIERIDRAADKVDHVALSAEARRRAEQTAARRPILVVPLEVSGGLQPGGRRRVRAARGARAEQRAARRHRDPPGRPAGAVGRHAGPDQGGPGGGRAHRLPDRLRDPARGVRIAGRGDSCRWPSASAASP